MDEASETGWAGPGVALMVAAMAVFAVQDAISRHLAEAHGVLMVVAIRYWFMAAFALVWASRRGGVRAVAATPARGSRSPAACCSPPRSA